jgi:hypothetical protein
MVIILAAVVSPSVAAQVNVRHYRYDLSVPSQEKTYSVEVPANAHGAISGWKAKGKGVKTRVASFRNGQKEARA